MPSELTGLLSLCFTVGLRIVSGNEHVIHQRQHEPESVCVDTKAVNDLYHDLKVHGFDTVADDQVYLGFLSLPFFEHRNELFYFPADDIEEGLMSYHMSNVLRLGVKTHQDNLQPIGEGIAHGGSNFIMDFDQRRDFTSCTGPQSDCAFKHLPKEISSTMVHMANNLNHAVPIQDEVAAVLALQEEMCKGLWVMAFKSRNLNDQTSFACFSQKTMEMFKLKRLGKLEADDEDALMKTGVMSFNVPRSNLILRNERAVETLDGQELCPANSVAALFPPTFVNRVAASLDVHHISSKCIHAAMKETLPSHLPSGCPYSIAYSLGLERIQRSRRQRAHGKTKTSTTRIHGTAGEDGSLGSRVSSVTVDDGASFNGGAKLLTAAVVFVVNFVL